MDLIKQWKVNTDGVTNGNPIPSGFYISVIDMHLGRVNGRYILTLCTRTSTDAEGIKRTGNDDFMSPSIMVDIGATVPTSAILTLVKNQMVILLDIAYITSSNYTEII